ncbi:MAG: hypothetical protein KDB88_07685, partial [Flavobacteriales bacterium]|nr:hypothetical protein [Flavobacteriales bacterium]
RPHPAAAYCPAALSELSTRLAFERVDLDRERAISYLRGQALPAKSASGWALMCHRDLGLGWAKGAGNRWNNHYPAPWRIRKQV